MRKKRGPETRGLVVGGLAMIGVLAFSPRPLDAAESTLAPTAMPAQPASNTVDIQVCFTLENLSKREACFAKQSDEDISACERIKPFSCKPYKEMYEAAQQLNMLDRQIMTLAQKKYASYQANDSTYLVNLASHIRAADKAWAAYRDAHCSLEPLLEGMSRAEASNLAEACRVNRTNARIKKLRGEVERLKN